MAGLGLVVFLSFQGSGHSHSPGESLEGPAAKPATSFQACSEFWSFQPLAKRDLPAVEDKSWVRTPIDAFILARLETEGMEPAPPANPRDLIRRVTFDATGLSPSQEEITDFVQDSSPDACLRLIDRLMSSLHFGERWGRHWLDVVRYAETEGFEYDRLGLDADQLSYIPGSARTANLSPGAGPPAIGIN